MVNNFGIKMKGIQIGYDQLDNGEKIYLKLPLKFYGRFISKITKQNIPDETTKLKFSHISSSTGNKYAFKFSNFFYFKLNQDTLNGYNKKRIAKNNNNLSTSKDINKEANDITTDKIYRFNLEIAKKSKIINMIKFEMNPLIKLSLNNSIKMKYGNYHGAHNQLILFNNQISNNKNEYDFSGVFPSMIPYRRFGISFNKNLIGNSNLHNLKVSYNKIFDYESNIKLSNVLRSNYIFNFCNIFNVLFSNEFIIKKSFVFLKKVQKNHIFSNYHIKSKIVDMFIEQNNNEINNGNNFYIQNISCFRLFDLPILKYFDLTKKILPYFALESFFIPRKSSNFKDFFKFIYNFGVSVQLKDNLFVDFSFITGASKNISIKKKHINSFRIKLSS